MKTLKTDLCIIGAGAGGLSVAAVATQLGLNVVIIERNKLGGDCLNYGCVPSKALLEAGHVAQIFREANQFGIKNIEPEVDFAKVAEHIRAIQDIISENDSQQRFEKLGATVILASAKFISKDKIVAGDYEISARHFVLAAGSSPFVPPIKGLDQVPFLTNETIFSLAEKPKHLLIIGGGPIGCELGFAFAELGVSVSLVEGKKILPRDEPELVEILRQRFIKRGITLYENAEIIEVQHTATKEINIICKCNGKQQVLSGSHLLISTGRRPNIKDLHLKAAQIEHTDHGIKVDTRLRTTNRKVYAIGDINGHYQFTHTANYQAGIVIRNILFRIPAKVDYRCVPWVTYTNPELAHAGLTEAEAIKQNKKIKITCWNFADNDRAQAAHTTVGQIKAITDHKGYILGASILGPHAGELLAPWILAMQNKMKISALTSIILPYPTLSEVNKFVANRFYKDLLFSPLMKRVVKFLRWLP
jgi:pyruvate/2-oxoglutarate dehydrogenase complex dihydrolipoamide dehydrogenase (E3) component